MLQATIRSSGLVEWAEGGHSKQDTSGAQSRREFQSSISHIIHDLSRLCLLYGGSIMFCDGMSKENPVYLSSRKFSNTILNLLLTCFDVQGAY